MAFTELHVTKGSGADDLNGGGPSLGTNDAPVDNPADCTATHSSGGLHTIVDNGGGGFSNTAVDDFVCWNPAGTPEYGIVTVKTDSSNITVQNLSAAAAFTNLANKKCNVGGAWATVDHAAGLVDTSFVNAAGDPPRTVVGAGTYSEKVTPLNAGTEAIPITLEGDSAGATPLIDGNADDCLDLFTVQWLVFRNLRLETSTASQHAIRLSFVSSEVGRISFIDLNLKASGSGGSGVKDLGGTRSITYWNVRCEDSGSDGFSFIFSDDSTLTGCTSVDAGGHAFYSASSMERVSFHGCIADNPATDGFHLGGSIAGYEIDGCSVYSPGRDGIRCAGLGVNAEQLRITNNVITNWAGYAINFTTSLSFHEDFNAFYDGATGTGVVTGVITEGSNDVTLTGDPYTDAAGGDFSLNDTAGAGAACRAAGWPGAFIDGVNVGNRDIGAVQHADPAGGGGGVGPAPLLLIGSRKKGRF